MEVDNVSYDELNDDAFSESSQTVRERVNRARNIQLQRLQGRGRRCNAQMTSADIKKFCKLDGESQKLLQESFEKLHLSARAYNRILKVARYHRRYWTIRKTSGRSTLPKRCSTVPWTENTECNVQQRGKKFAYFLHSTKLPPPNFTNCGAVWAGADNFEERFCGSSVAQELFAENFGKICLLLKQNGVEKAVASLQNSGAKAITCFSDAFPQSLADIPDPSLRFVLQGKRQTA